MLQHRLRRGASYLTPRRSQRGHVDLHHGLLNYETLVLFGRALMRRLEQAMATTLSTA